MASFLLKIVTPDGLRFEGPAEELVVRTTTGDTGILAGHINYVAPLGMGRATVISGGKTRYAACIGGMVSVVNGTVTLVPTSFEWAENIDAERADASRQRAEAVLADRDATETDVLLAKARLKRARVRIGVAGEKKNY